MLIPEHIISRIKYRDLNNPLRCLRISSFLKRQVKDDIEGFKFYTDFQTFAF